MRRLVALVISVVFLAACSGGSSKKATPTPPTETGIAATPASTPAATPVPTTTEDTALEQDVRACMMPDLPVDETGAVSRLDECLNPGELSGYEVVGVTGDVPIIVIERSETRGSCRASGLIVWRRNGWHVQNARALLSGPVRDRFLPPPYVMPPTLEFSHPSTFIRQKVEGESVLLAVLTTVASYCGSGPGTMPLLFALDGDAWRLAWDPRGTELERLSDQRSEFIDGAGIDHVHVRGSLWFADSSPEIFYEAHPGPHRYADQFWVRDGQRYVLSESREAPSAYATLFDFVYRLSTGNDAGATALLADPNLLGTAKRLGLAQKPLGQRWTTNLDVNTECCGPIHILSGPQWNGGPPQPIVVTFVQRGGDWLISGIAAE